MLHSVVNQKTSTPKRMALFQYYQIVVKYYLKTLLRSLKVATLAADNARLSIILIQTLFLIKERDFSLLSLPVEFHIIIRLSDFYFYHIFSYSLFPFFTHINYCIQTHEKAAQHPTGCCVTIGCICYFLQMRLIRFRGNVRVARSLRK